MGILKVPSSDINQLLKGSSGSLLLFLLEEHGWAVPREAHKQFELCDKIMNVIYSQNIKKEVT